MTGETHVDGNAMAALLHDLFGEEMTDSHGCCDVCGTISLLAQLVVYRQAPGDVMRCPACGTVLMVAVSRPEGLRVTFQALRWVELHQAVLTV